MNTLGALRPHPSSQATAVSDPRAEEQALVERCAVAAGGGVLHAHDAQEASLFLLAAGLLPQELSTQVRQLRAAGSVSDFSCRVALGQSGRQRQAQVAMVERSRLALHRAMRASPASLSETLRVQGLTHRLRGDVKNAGGGPGRAYRSQALEQNATPTS